MNKPSDLLQLCADVFSFPETHCKGYYAKRIDGSTTHATFPDADRWCALGAVDAAHQELGTTFSVKTISLAYLNKAAKAKGAIAQWNDKATTTKTKVQQTFQRAANMARKAGV
jgi:hypothetical protein